MNKQLVSVIIPTYKRPASIVKRAIDSVLSQTYRHLEIIVVDDSPGDYVYRSKVENMIFLLNRKKIMYIKHEVNKGACAARNTGIIASKGDYIAFLDDDDEWLPEKLEKQMLLMNNPDCGLIYCRHFIVNDISKNIKEDERLCYTGEVFSQLIINNFIGSTSFVLIRKECIDIVGLFNTELKSAQDYEMWLRIAKEFKIAYVDEPLVKYHIHNSERISSNAGNKVQGLEMINAIHSDYLASHNKTNSIRMIKITPYYLAADKRDIAWKIYLKAIMLAPFNFRNNLRYLMYFLKRNNNSSLT
jgi:glycosyltransferase involved in cell wall biosynthesis